MISDIWIHNNYPYQRIINIYNAPISIEMTLAKSVRDDIMKGDMDY